MTDRPPLPPSPPRLPPPGWYPDPWRVAAWRWWDGLGWSPATSTATSTATPAAHAGPRPLPLRAAGTAALGLLAGVVLGGVASGVVFALTGGSATAAPVTVAGLVGLWVGLLGACVIASRRFGTGRLGADLGLAWRPWDVVLGLGAYAAGMGVAVVLEIIIAAIGATSSNTAIISNEKGSTFGLLAVAMAAVVGAPVVEELFFRGLVLRSLSSRVGVGWAIVGQALVFGLAHADPTGGWRTLSLSVITAGFGLSQGFFAHRWGRLGPTMVAHGLFNLLPVLLIATGH